MKHRSWVMNGRSAATNPRRVSSKYRSLVLCALAALTLSTVGSRPAKADEVLFDSAGFIEGTQSFDQSFDLTTPGTLTITLTNVAWPQQLASLNLLVSSTNATLGPQMGTGTESFAVAPGDVFAQWFGTAQGPLNTGVYSVKIAFVPSPVPLPTSVALLLSGLGLLIWQRRMRSGGAEALRSGAEHLQTM